MNLKRKSGVLLHITSLPGPWGMGEMGPQARAFGEFLAASGQTLWQILPLNPVGQGGCAYSSLSAFAGNPLLISFDELMEEGLLSRRNLSRFPAFDSDEIDFPAVIEARMKVLHKVCDRFEPDAAFEAFCEAEAGWLDDYALFMTIREAHECVGWLDWPAPLRDRDAQALEAFAAKHERAVGRHRILQFLFSKQWKKLRGFYRDLGVELIGDVPIFVAGDSADVWANRELFLLNEDGSSSVVAGVPPDYFSETGQRWGNPLYDWEVHQSTQFAWWTDRMRRTFEQVDTVRVDHFRGFEAYWEIPADEPTAMNGRWVQAPGRALFQTLEKRLRSFPGFGKRFKLADHVIAENLGIITDEVEQLREDCGFPGMWVLQFRFGAMDMNKPGFVPEGVEENWAVYTGTHDNDTVRSWFEQMPQTLPPDAGGEFDFERGRILDYLKTDGSEIHRDFVRLALRAPAERAILPLQDVLGAGARMNIPGTVDGNWGWRVSEDMLSEDIVEFLKEETVRSGRA